MGLFDTLMKDIASGELDKKLGKLADTVEQLSGTVGSSVEKLVEKPEKLSQTAEMPGEHEDKAIDTISVSDLPAR